jgi:hypothetical protein
MSLDKERMFRTVFSIYLDSNDQSPEEIARELMSEIKKARKAGVTDLRVAITRDATDDYNLPSDYIVLRGNAFETEDEWHNRLQHEKNCIKNKIVDAQKTLQVIPYYSNELDKIDAALAKSKLRCIDCGSPENYLINSQDTNNKTIRICDKCHELREEKREAKEKKYAEKRAKETA